MARIRKLNMRDCELITDAGLVHLRGINTLHMAGCKLITDAGLAHLTGIRMLDMDVPCSPQQGSHSCV